MRGRSEWDQGEGGVDSTVKKDKFQEGEEGKARIASLGEVKGSMSG